MIEQKDIIKKLNPNQRRRIYEQLVERDGEWCQFCERKPPDVKLEIDRLKRELGYGELSNLRLLCKPCNTRRSPRGKKQKNGRSSTEIVESPRSFSKEFLKNAEAEPRFRRTVYQLMHKYKTISVDDAVDAGCEAAACSIQTGYRYLRKMTSLLGDFKITERKEIIWKNGEDGGPA